MRKPVALFSILSASFLVTGCGDYLDLEPDEPRPDTGLPDAAPPGPLPDAGPGYPPLPPPVAFPDEPVVTTPGQAPAPPAGDVADGVQLVFPPPVSLTTAREVTVRGTARLPGGVSAVRVNGVDARLSPPNAQGAVAWQAEVQVTLGQSELTVSSVAGSGTVTPATRASITFAPDMLVRPAAMDLDVGHDRLLVSDHMQGVVAIDLRTGTPISLRLAEPADGPVLPYSLSVDAVAGRAMALFRQTNCNDASRQNVQGAASIDLRDGAVVVAEEFDPYSICDLVEPRSFNVQAVVLDASRERFFYLYNDCPGDGSCYAEVRQRALGDGEPPAASVPLCADTRCDALDMRADRRSEPAGLGLLALVHVTGVEPERAYEVRAIDPAAATQRRIATVQTVWDGTELYPEGIALDAAGNRLLVQATGSALVPRGNSRLYVIAIDLATGAQSLLLADVAPVDGARGWRFKDWLHDPRRDRLIFADDTRGLIAVDLATGSASLLLQAAIGEGPTPVCPLSDAYCQISTLDGGRQRFFVHAHDNAAGDVYVVDLATGERRLLSPRGSGPEFGIYPRLLADDVEDRLLVMTQSDGMYTVDGATGERAYVGALPPFVRDLAAWDPARNRILYIAEDGNALHAFDVGTGRGQVISSDTVGSGPSLRPPADFDAVDMRVTLDASGTRAFVSEMRGRVLYSVDLLTRERTAHAVGEPAVRPPESEGPRPVLADTRRNRLLVGGLSKDAIGAIDLATGASSVFLDAYRVDPPLWRIHELMPDHGNDRALMVDDRSDVHLLDLLTGERVLILQTHTAETGDFE